MWFAKRNIVFFALSALLSATGIFAQESVDCIEYSGDPDPRCVYQRLDAPVTKGLGLFVVPDGMDVVRANAIRNTDFYVYAPKAGSDSVTVKLIADNSEVKHMDKVNSGDSGVVAVVANGIYGIFTCIGGAQRFCRSLADRIGISIIQQVNIRIFFFPVGELILFFSIYFGA